MLMFYQTSDDAYVMAMKLLQSRCDAGDSQKIAVYFDYSSESDVPVFLENWQRYKVLQDMSLLIPSLVEVCAKGKERNEQWTSEHEQVYIQTLQDKIEITKRYMANNPDWFHLNMQSDIAEEVPPMSFSTFNRSTEPLPVVTVEYNRGPGHADHVDAVIQSPDFSTGRKIRSLPAVGMQKPCKDDVDKHSNIDSYSSSLEDLEYDIDFILNPSLPSKARYAVSPNTLLNTLPAILPSIDYTTTVLPPQLTKSEAQCDGGSSGFDTDTSSGSDCLKSEVKSFFCNQ